jgi:ribonucleotide reductase beta subunit family protein with ferritin-like domain
MVESFAKRVGCEGLSQNKALPWSRESIERHKDSWDWRALSFNERLPWSPELIERFVDRWDWDALSDNEGVPWSYGRNWVTAV